VKKVQHDGSNLQSEFTLNISNLLGTPVFIRNLEGLKLYRIMKKYFYAFLATFGFLFTSCQEEPTADENNTQTSTTTIPLVQSVAFKSNNNCLNGGLEVMIGFDANDNDILEESEIIQTHHVCAEDGTDGTDGVDGATGLNSLINTSPESSGDNCAIGGLKLETGLDANANNILETEEVTSTNYICNGVTEETGTDYPELFVEHTEYKGDNCEFGGVKTESGFDENLNGVLDDEEIETVVYDCQEPVNYAPTGFGFTYFESTNDDYTQIQIGWTKAVDVENEEVYYDVYINDELMEEDYMIEGNFFLAELTIEYDLNSRLDIDNTVKVVATDASGSSSFIESTFNIQGSDEDLGVLSSTSQTEVDLINLEDELDGARKYQFEITDLPENSLALISISGDNEHDEARVYDAEHNFLGPITTHTYYKQVVNLFENGIYYIEFHNTYTNSNNYLININISVDDTKASFGTINFPYSETFDLSIPEDETFTYYFDIEDTDSEFDNYSIRIPNPNASSSIKLYRIVEEDNYTSTSNISSNYYYSYLEEDSFIIYGSISEDLEPGSYYIEIENRSDITFTGSLNFDIDLEPNEVVREIRENQEQDFYHEQDF